MPCAPFGQKRSRAALLRGEYCLSWSSRVTGVPCIQLLRTAKRLLFALTRSRLATTNRNRTQARAMGSSNDRSELGTADAPVRPPEEHARRENPLGSGETTVWRSGYRLDAKPGKAYNRGRVTPFGNREYYLLVCVTESARTATSRKTRQHSVGFIRHNRCYRSLLQHRARMCAPAAKGGMDFAGRASRGKAFSRAAARR